MKILIPNKQGIEQIAAQVGQKIMAYGTERLRHVCFYGEMRNVKLCSNIFVA